MTVITWQNINAPSAAPASDVLARANQSIAAALADFGNIFQQAENTQLANQNAIKSANTEDALNTLYQFVKPEDLQNAQRTGALTDLFSKYGGNYDKAVIRNALDTRPTTLMDREMAADNYVENQRVRAEKPVYDSILGRAYKDPRAALKEAESSSLFQKPQLLRDIYDIQKDQIAEQRDAAEDARSAARSKREEEIHNRKLKALEREDALLSGNIALSQLVSDYQASEAAGYEEYSKRFFLKTPYNPLTATSEERKHFNAANKDGRYVKDPEAVVAEATKKLRAQLSPEVFAQIQPTIASRFVSGIKPSGVAQANLETNLRENEAELEAYKRTGFYKDDLGITGPAALKALAIAGINAAAAETAKNTGTGQLDVEEVLNPSWMDKQAWLGGSPKGASLLDLIDAGMNIYDPDSKETVRFDFPAQEVRHAVALLKGGDEQAAAQYLEQLKDGMEKGVVDGSYEAFTSRLEGLKELNKYNELYEKQRRISIKSGEAGLKAAGK